MKSLLSDDSLRPLVPLLDKSVPLFSQALIRPLRLVSLVAGIAILIAGAFLTPSDDWDIPICFVMAIPAYVLAPWAFRQVYYFRWRWMPLAAVALWMAIDVTYTLYWWLRDFAGLQEFRPANFFYCMWLFWICGFIWNIDWTGGIVGWKTDTAELRAREVKFVAQLLSVLLVIVGLTLLVAFLCGFVSIYPFHWNF